MTLVGSSCLAVARAADEAGLCVLPPKEDGSKRPLPATWERYQSTCATRAEIEAWFTTNRSLGIGLVCGAVSGHLVLFEFDDLGVYDRFLVAASEAGLGPLVARIREGYEEQTPGDGIHWFCRVPPGSAKTEALARRMGLDRNDKPCALPLIETKGQGGYAIIAPSSGGVHPSGKPYVLRSGGVGSITPITEAERDALWSLARSFTEIEPPQPREEHVNADGKWLIRPGDDFNACADWRDILEPHGWEAVKERSEATLWRRPGGYEGGWGASTNHGGRDLLHVWTTAAPPFQPDKSYAKFTAYALLNHDGDFRAAAAMLEAEGYGERHPQSEAAPSADAGADPGRQLVAVMPFPVEALPEPARAFVTAGAKALGCPPDFVALPLLAFIGAVAGNSRKLRLKHRFLVAPIFWIGVIGAPGTAKTPALDLSRGLVDALQKASWELYLAKLEEWLDEAPKERGPQPRPEHFFATDTTTEAIAFALQKSRGLTVIHDELVGWVSGFDAYRKGGDRQTWLSLWSGQPLKPNRKTGEPIYIPEPVVCVTGGIQPDVLPDLAGEAARNDGFLSRFLLGWPNAAPSPWTEEVVSDDVVNAMAKVVIRLRVENLEPAVTHLSHAAYREWIGWFNENVAAMANASGLAAGWAAKAPVHLARIALALHLLAQSDEAARLSAETMRDAILIVEYFRDHLSRVLPAFGALPVASGAGLASRIRRVLTQAAPAWVTRTDLNGRLGGHVPATEIAAALDRLAQEGAAVRRFAETGGRTREEWRAAPVSHRDTRKKPEEDGESPPADTEPLLVPSFSVSPHGATGETDAPDARWERWEEPL